MDDVAMLERRFISARMDLVMLNFSFEFHTVFDKQKVLILKCLHQRRSVKCLYFPHEKATFELNFSTIKMACYSAIHVHLPIV